MTISDVAYHAGLTPGNVVFYEKKDFISPNNVEDGRRDYHKHDMEILKKIRLLRTLGISLEDTKLVINKEIGLADALYTHINRLSNLTVNTDASFTATAIEICTKIRKDLTSETPFDIDIYFREYADFFDTYTGELNKDCVPLALCPIRRFLARWFDWHFYFVLWTFILYNIGLSMSEQSYFELGIDICVMPLLLMFILEPLFLMIFTTTPGKWLLGLRVTDNNGRHLPYLAGLARLFSIMFGKESGTYRYESWFYYYILYQKCVDGETLKWEYDSNIYVKDESIWRSIAFGIECILLLIAACFIISRPAYPTDVDNKGDITIQEFAENYNELLPHNSYRHLNSVGKWVDDIPKGTAVVNLQENIYPSYRYITENNTHGSYHSNDIMKGVYFTVEQENIARPDSCIDDIRNLLTAFLKAQPEYDDNPQELENILNSISKFTSFEFTVYNVKISCIVTSSGYKYSDTVGLFQTDKNVETYVKLEFTMTKN